MITLKKAIIVEGKYDKIRLENIFDTVILTTNGFRIFKDNSQAELIKKLAYTVGIIILTDSDSAGNIIRAHIKKIAPLGNIINVYLPQIIGTERRKQRPSSEGFLGVEGIDDNIIIETFSRYGVLDEKPQKSDLKITKTTLYVLGLTGGNSSKVKRQDFLKFLKLPINLSSNAFLEVVNKLYTPEQFILEAEKWQQGLTKN